MQVSFYDLLEAVRLRPALYISPLSITALYNFIHGYLLCTGFQGATNTQPPWREFNNWVAMRLGFRESTSGWRNMILTAAAEAEDRALDRFFELLEEFKQRQARVIMSAKLPTPSTSKIWRIQIHGDSKVEIPPPSLVEIIKYTDDKGVFIRYSDVAGKVIEEEYAWDIDFAYFWTESLVKPDEWQRNLNS